ncbi:hypothetical protein [Aquimarina algiphila]|uniref:Uncharacterized protein n=1 Tax=Aquimarina algiphila TaxID=2047982 RepID=A0A554VCS1_9FLAO|nr:hypothetical protein [Aquimarina algiphila]TSE04581.1 hypothetical protein FOF46_25905 [Aquimarina algiphila]
MENKIIKLIKKVDLDSPSMEFTDAVMEQLSMDIESKLRSDNLFVSVREEMKKTDLKEEFTNSVLLNINLSQSKIKLRPIIKKSSGMIFAVVIMVLIILSFLVKGETSSTIHTKTNDLYFISDLINNSPKNISILFICIITVSILLWIDFMINHKIFKGNF